MNGYNKDFKRYFDLVQIVVVTLDREGRVTFINRKGCEILGYEESEIIGKDWFSNFLPRDKGKEAFQIFKDIIDGKVEITEYYENPILTKDGKERIISWRNSILRDNKGVVVGTLSAGEDITELRKTEEDLQKRLKYLGTLYRVASQLLGEELDIHKRAKATLQICVEEFGVDLAWIGYARSNGKVKIIAQYPEEHPYTKGLDVRWDDTPLEQGPTGRAIRTGNPQITEDTSINESYEPWREKALQHGFRSTGAFPLITRGTTFGTLNLYSSKPNFFTPERVEFIQNLTHIVASGLENSRLFEETQRRLQKIQALHNIDVAIAGSTDIKVILNIALDEIIRQLNVDAVDVFLYSPYNQSLEYTVQQGFRSRLFNVMPIKLGEGIVGRVALERRSIKVLNLAEEESWIRKDLILEEGFVSYYGVPLIAKGQLLGVLEVFKRSPIEEDEEWEE
ncbi:MAG: GAF domain-containing protein [bacterium]